MSPLYFWIDPLRVDIIWRSSNKVGEELDVVATANSTEMVRSLVASKVGISLLNMKPPRRPGLRRQQHLLFAHR